MRVLDAVLPTSGKPKQQLDSIFEDDERLRAFTIDWISRKLKDSQIYENGVSGEFLSSLAGFRDSSEIARNIVADFVALPYEYIVSLPLPASFDQLASSITDSKQANPRVHKIDEDFRAKFRSSDAVSEKEPSPFDSIFGSVGLPRMPEDGVCLQIDSGGFVDQYGISLTAAHAIEQARSFFGLGLAVALFQVGQQKTTPIFGRVRKQIFVHRVDGESVYLDTAFEIDPEFSDFVERIEIVGANDKTSEVNWRAFYAGSNQLLAFVQAMVALEILLGDKESSDLTGLTELLSNRCAYLLGETQSERHGILQKFRAIYHVRSQIVHSGKSRLSDKEQVLFLNSAACAGRFSRRRWPSSSPLTTAFRRRCSGAHPNLSNHLQIADIRG
jgi:hypothetical protein